MRQDIIPIGGLNTDDDPRHFQQGDYEDMRNLHVGPTQDQGDEGVITTVKSDTTLALPELGGTTTNWLNFGVAKDEENDRVYLLVYGEVSSVGYFAIIKHDILTNTFKRILLGLASDWGISAWSATMQKAHNPRVVDGRLIWTDNVNDIRQVDVDKIEATTDAGIDTAAVIWNQATAVSPGYSAGDFVYYLNYVYEVLQSTTGVSATPNDAPTYYDELELVESVYLDPTDPNNFTLAALPPLIAPSAEYLPDPLINVNQLKGKIWQFSYQYIYMDYRKSTFAPPSISPPPSQEEDVNGNPDTNPSTNNTIRLSINTGNEQVRIIRVVARSSEDPSTWFVVEDIYVVTNDGYRVYGANQNIQLDFRNDKPGDVVDSSDVYKLFNYVPIKAKHMDLIEGNRLVFGNITEGYPVLGTNVEIDLSWEDLEAITTQTFPLAVTEMAQWVSEDIFDFLLRFTLPSTNPGACTFRIAVTQDDINDPYVFSDFAYNGTDPYPSTVKAGLLAALEVDWPGETDTCFVASDYTLCAFPRRASTWNRPYIGWLYYFERIVSSVGFVDKYTQLKTGATHAWAILYRDIVGRITPLVGKDQMTKYIPFPTENTSSNVGRRPIINFEINHLPPPQAASYEIVYAGNKSSSWHLQLLGYNFTYGRKYHDDPASAILMVDYYRIRVKKAQSNTRDNLLNWSVEEYVWQKGDRIRIIGKVDALGVLTEINDAIYDVEIMAVFEDHEYAMNIGDDPHDNTEIISEWIYFPVNDNLPSFTPGTGSTPNVYPDNLLVEIYRPSVTETNLYFTTGMTFEIGVDVYGNRFHKGDVNQILTSGGQPSTPATVVNTSHDNWKFLRNIRDVADSLNFALWVESQYVSDFYQTNLLTSQGSPIPALDSQAQNVLTKRIRHGGKINIGSQVNLIAQFDYDDFEDLKDEYGPIEGLRMVGFVLKAVQYNRVTSIYIQRIESYTAAGNPQYLFTDDVFGSVRPAMENWGTKHPDSVIVHNRHLYFWDESEGIVVRDSANGMEAISSNKMKRFFQDLAETLKAYGTQHNVWVHFAFSISTNELFCLFGTGTGDQEIITFSEDNQRWKHKFDVSFERGLLYWMGRRLFQATLGNVYEWWAGTTYNQLSGSARTPSLVFYGNEDPAKVKIFKAVHVYMTGGRPQFNSLTVPAKATAGSGQMETNIYDVNIEEREGVFYCQILRDINTPGAGDQADKEMNGRKMRGLFIRVDMDVEDASDPTAKVTLSNLAVLSTGSERSK